MADELQRRRRTDRWFGFITRLWDWVDDRDIDKHTISVMIMWGTWRITEWAMSYAHTSPRPGLEVAAIIAAVVTPYSALQAAAIAFYFKSRTTP
jgi:hypothetical protein